MPLAAALATATSPAGVEELVIYSAWTNAERDLTILVGARRPEDEKGVWRRDWTFTQDMLEDLTGRPRPVQGRPGHELPVSAADCHSGAGRGR